MVLKYIWIQQLLHVMFKFITITRNELMQIRNPYFVWYLVNITRRCSTLYLFWYTILDKIKSTFEKCHSYYTTGARFLRDVVLNRFTRKHCQMRFAFYNLIFFYASCLSIIAYHGSYHLVLHFFGPPNVEQYNSCCRLIFLVLFFQTTLSVFLRELFI